MAWRLPRRPLSNSSWSWPWSWPRRLAYPTVGTLLSLGLVAGLLTLEGWRARHPPTISWIIERLREQPLIYAYLFLATLIMMTVLGWIVGRKEDLLEELSVTDPLTGLANRRALQDALYELRESGEPFALFFMDMDGFKAINDRYGHDVGDTLLKEIGRRLASTVRTGDVVSRLGGDEFVVASRGVTDARTGERIAAAICREVSKSFVVAGRAIETSASVGVVLTGAGGAAGVVDAASAVLPAEAEDNAQADDPLCLADAAMYEAKRAGRNTWRMAPNAEMMAGGRRAAARGVFM